MTQRWTLHSLVRGLAAASLSIAFLTPLFAQESLAPAVSAAAGTVAPDAAAASEGSQLQELSGAAAGSTEGLSKKIYLDLRDINVVDVIKFLGLEGDLNIVTSRNVQGRSTLLLKNVSIQDALDIISVSNQLAYNVKSGIVYIMTEDEYAALFGTNFNDQKKIVTRKLKYAKPSYAANALQAVASSIGKVIVDEGTGTIIMIDTEEKLMEMNALLDQIEYTLDTEVYHLQYANAKDVEAQLKAVLEAKGVGEVFGDARSNQLVISAYPGRMDEVKPLVEALDAKNKAVLIEARILQLTLNPKFDYGVDWESLFSTRSNHGIGDINLEGSFPIDSTISSAAAIGSVQRIAIGVLDSDDESAFEFRAMKQISQTNTLANPRLMVLDRQEATISIGDTIPYVITTTTGTGNNVSISENIKFIEVGISLSVTPVIHDDGFITMTIKPELSSQTGTLTTPASARIPIVNASTFSSTVVVKDGVTVILGGLRRDEMIEDTQGFPYLQDVPIVGHLFKSRDEEIKKTEIVVFITPKIVNGGTNVTGEPLPILGSPAAGIQAPVVLGNEPAAGVGNMFSSSRISYSSPAAADVVPMTHPDMGGRKMKVLDFKSL
ncbi:MAG: hypothetical protein A2Z83_06860 [Omnitrophica bacterium GWA2_52_8]|nr:MAG: hypothetical protein A2Z83_06860 [Omnitrophica bacterium GWA2_52_8]